MPNLIFRAFKASQRGKLSKRSTDAPQKAEGRLNPAKIENSATLPPSYDELVLQTQSKYRRSADDIVKYGWIPLNEEASTKGVSERCSAFVELDESCKLTFGQEHPQVVVEKIRRFLLYCVAYSYGVDTLLTLPESERQYFLRLRDVYCWSWVHQTVYGWEETAPELQHLAFEIFHFFIELPLDKLGLPQKAFTWHLQKEEPHTLRRDHTLRALRSQGDLNRFHLLLESIDIILESISDRSMLHQEIYRRCREEMVAELRALTIPTTGRKRCRYYIAEDPDWIRFDKLYDCGKMPIQLAYPRPKPTVFKKNVSSGETKTTARILELEQLPDFSAIRSELECNPWT